MIQLITGKPGAGKTFLMVSTLLDTFYRLDKESDEYVMSKDCFLISNIPDLALDHMILDEAMDRRIESVARRHIFNKGGNPDDGLLLEAEVESLQDQRVSLFFNYRFQELLGKKKGVPIVYAISEAQKLFGKAHIGNKKKELHPSTVFNLLEEHRHLGLTMYLDSQNRKKIHDEILSLVELEIDARPRTLNMGKTFKYHEYADGQKLTTVPKIKRADPKVFAVYRSQQTAEVVKPQSYAKKAAVFVLVVSMLGWYTYGDLIQRFDTGEPVTGKPGLVSDVHASSSSSFKSKLELPPPPKKNYDWYPVSHARIGSRLMIVDPRLNVIIPAPMLGRKVKSVYGHYYMALESGDREMIDIWLIKINDRIVSAGTDDHQEHQEYIEDV